MTEQWLDVGAADKIRPGEFEVVETDDFPVAIFNIDGAFFAIEDICTHDGAELTGGPVDGDEIICPRHGATFCIRTGEALTPPAYEAVRTFETRVENGIVQVRVND